MNLSRGHYQAFGAYFTWGVFPIYWKYLKHISSTEILLHRIIWSFIFVGILTFGFKKASIKKLATEFKSQTWYVILLALFIVANWFIYVYAVNIGQILQGSLAYFMTPLLNIVLGALVFQESLSRGMKIATAVAAFGVLILTLLNVTFPWIALSLALTFSVYGVLKKKTQLGGIESSFLENAVMFLPALVAAHFVRENSSQVLTTLDWMLFIGSGVITATPILLFSLSTRTIPFNHVGVLQFLAPTLQFLIGYFIYHEVVSPPKFVAFAFVWIGVGLYLREILKRKTPA